MESNGSCGRRTFIVSAASTAIAMTTLAGCGGGGGGDSGGGGTPDTETPGSGQPSFDGWMENVANYDTLVDETGSDRVTVTVGAQGNGGNFAFAPPAVEVSSGTTVVWEWNGKGGQHNVVHDGGDFESDLVSEEGHTFEYTFDSAGPYKYYCDPHKTVGMKGVVVVK